MRESLTVVGVVVVVVGVVVVVVGVVVVVVVVGVVVVDVCNVHDYTNVLSRAPAFTHGKTLKTVCEGKLDELLVRVLNRKRAHSRWSSGCGCWRCRRRGLKELIRTFVDEDSRAGTRRSLRV